MDLPIFIIGIVIAALLLIAFILLIWFFGVQPLRLTLFMVLLFVIFELLMGGIIYIGATSEP